MLLRDRKIIVTGGPTREWIDPVRFISNPSSGRMGIAIADEAFERTSDVVFIHGPIEGRLLEDRAYRALSIETTGELLETVLSELKSNAVLIMAAAPVDFTPLKRASTKIKKGSENLLLRLGKTPDILKSVASLCNGDGSLSNLFVVGFAAETDNIEENALKKLADKELDMICLNDISNRAIGFGSDKNIITIFTKKNERIELPLLSKRAAAKEILNKIEKELENLKSI